ncbi:MAG TPA: Druantia anti-phage system protein DruA [Gemmatimonadales bacterium]|nr:Druantia anti-phage system protein DruA [Gemmatimonadales bacterium]
MLSVGPRQFTPRLPEAERLRLLEILQRESSSAFDVVADLRKTAASSAGQGSVAFRAACLLLADLSENGWAIHVARGQIWIEPPSWMPLPGETPQDVKARLRAALRRARDRQLGASSVRRFLRAMERPRMFNGRRVSVLDLVDRGQELEQILGGLRSQPDEERLEALSRLIQPVVQVCDDNTRCEHTGLLLRDVWRYFRHTWVLEYRPTPGRTLQLLIRNRARPNWPVIGIAMLANAPLHLRVRDEWIGWTTTALKKRIASGEIACAQVAEALTRAIAEAVERIRHDDLIREEELRVPTEETVRLLRAAAAEAAVRRQDELVAAERRRQAGERVRRRSLSATDGTIDWQVASEAPLFRRKRAAVLADLMECRLEFERSGLGRDPERALAALLSSERGTRAVNRALAELRKQGLATRVLDVSVCGAVAPYNILLGGKLVALLLASEEVRRAYADRYSGQPSHIASQMAGRVISRPADLVLLTTTSLYGVGSSQYNRLRLAAREHQGLGSDVAWEPLARAADGRGLEGTTSGFGTAHLSAQTLEALREVSRTVWGMRRVNNEFGEGTSPRLRQVREGVEALGLSANDILQHSTPRLVYACKLVPDAIEQLLGIAPRGGYRAPSTEALTRAWIRRWLLGRSTRPDVLQALRALGPESIAAELRARAEDQFTLEFCTPRVVTAKATRALDPRSHPMSFVRRLYKSMATCADHHSDEQLLAVHVETPVERYVRNALRAGKVVFVTGSPGDGKTHMLRAITLKEGAGIEVAVILDGNDRSDAELGEVISEALRAGKGLGVAINEGTLLDLALAHQDRHQWAKETLLQLRRPVRYDDENGTGTVVVVDLSLRNNLSPEITRRVLRMLTGLVLEGCDECGEEECPAALNARLLRHAVVEDRLVAMLAQVALGGYHATMRDVHAYVSFLIFGGLTCSELRRRHGAGVPSYAEHAFVGGQGDLFEAVRRLDPADVTHPLLDDRLWRGADARAEWLGPSRPPEVDSAASPLEERWKQFARRKRRAFFEHRDGDAILTQMASGQSGFDLLLNSADFDSPVRYVRLLNRFYDRDSEVDGVLYLWVAHRYDARPPRYAASRLAVPVEELRVLRPRPPAHVRDAFPDYVPDHVVLCHRDMPADAGLRIDEALLRALSAAGKGLPPSFRAGEPWQRVGNFIDKLARHSGSKRGATDGVAVVRFVDLDTGRNWRIGVDLRGKRYQDEE